MDVTEIARRRRASLVNFRRALCAAMRDMPAGYKDAMDDRNRFAAPIEHVIVELEKELTRG